MRKTLSALLVLQFLFLSIGSELLHDHHFGEHQESAPVVKHADNTEKSDTHVAFISSCTTCSIVSFLFTPKSDEVVYTALLACDVPNTPQEFSFQFCVYSPISSRASPV